MRADEKKGRNVIEAAILAVLVTGGLFFYCSSKTPFMMTNDNFYLRSIVSGQMTGTPEFRMYYMGIVFGGLVSTLYKLFPAGEWYGMAMVLSVAVSLGYFLYRLFLACGTTVTRCIVAAVTAFLVFGFLTQHIVKSEFTTITGIVGCASVFSMYLMDETKGKREYARGMIPVLLFAAWSVGMRDKAYYMLVPFIGMIFLGKLKDAHDTGTRAAWSNVIVLYGSWICVLLFIRIGTEIAYGSSDWKNFRMYTDASEEIFDYYGMPEYETYREVYEELGITRSSYEAVTGHYNILLDPAINGHSMEVLAQIGADEEREAAGDLNERINSIVSRFVERNFTSYSERPLNILAYLLYLLIISAAFVMRKLRIVRDVGAVVVARMFLWIWLIDRGRFPTRVTQIIYIAEIMLLVGIVLKHEVWRALELRKGERVFPAGAAAAGLLLCLVCARFGVPVAKAHMAEARSWYHFSADYRELQTYLAEHSDKFYYFDMSHLYFEEEVFARPDLTPDANTGKKVRTKQNYLYMGSWMPKSPWYDKVFAGLGVTDAGEALITNDRIYLLYQEVDFDTWDFLKRYYEEHYPGSELRIVDQFTASNGTRYDIIKGYWK